MTFIKTHLINRQIINEYLKIKDYGYRTFLFIDNKKNMIESKKINPATYNFYGIDVECLIVNMNDYNDLKLQLYGINLSEDDYSVIMYNCEYPFYIFSKYVKNFDYVWLFDYDVYNNSKDYTFFFNRFCHNSADLISTGLSELSPDHWLYGMTDWYFEDRKRYATFYPVVRLSYLAIKYLYMMRKYYSEVFKIFKNENSIKENWIHCETFTATELMNNDYFKCERLNEPNIIWDKEGHPSFFNEKRYLSFDNMLYHPVKRPVFLEEIKDRTFIDRQ